VTDITTPEAHVEIKVWKRFQEVPGQLAKYHQAVRRDKLCVYFFGPEPSGERYAQVLALMEAADIEVYSFGPDDEVRKHESTQPGLDVPGMRALIQFQESHIIAEKRAVLDWRSTLTAFRDWASSNGLRLPEKDKVVKELFMVRFGKFVDNRSGNMNVYGWRHFRYMPSSGSPLGLTTGSVCQSD
jgi:hypothetical protein